MKVLLGKLNNYDDRDNLKAQFAFWEKQQLFTVQIRVDMAWVAFLFVTLNSWVLGCQWEQRPIKNYHPSMSKKDNIADETPRSWVCVSHSPLQFGGEGTGHFRSSGEQFCKSIQYSDDVVSLYGSCRNNALPQSSWVKLQLHLACEKSFLLSQ